MKTGIVILLLASFLVIGYCEDPLCPCPRILSPVCGSLTAVDGTVTFYTYGNQCDLDCKGATYVKDGPCDGDDGAPFLG